jgi:hypothetical protein
MASDPAGSEKPLFVLTTSVIRWALEQLQDLNVHAFFPAYLEIRRTVIRSELNAADTVQPTWADLEPYFQVPNGPPKKPLFQPFSQGEHKEGKGWMNRNIAGSYAPSSIRELPKKVVKPIGSGYALRDGHAELALAHFLSGERIPVIPLATYYYRNFGFTTDGPSIGPHNLIDVFLDDFEFEDHLGEFETLFTPGIPDRTDWFERWMETFSEESD